MDTTTLSIPVTSIATLSGSRYEVRGAAAEGTTVIYNTQVRHMNPGLHSPFTTGEWFDVFEVRVTEQHTLLFDTVVNDDEKRFQTTQIVSAAPVVI